jgi:hypothetical protein
MGAKVELATSARGSSTWRGGERLDVLLNACLPEGRQVDGAIIDSSYRQKINAGRQHCHCKPRIKTATKASATHFPQETFVAASRTAGFPALALRLPSLMFPVASGGG